MIHLQRPAKGCTQHYLPLPLQEPSHLFSHMAQIVERQVVWKPRPNTEPFYSTSPTQDQQPLEILGKWTEQPVQMRYMLSPKIQRGPLGVCLFLSVRWVRCNNLSFIFKRICQHVPDHQTSKNFKKWELFVWYFCIIHILRFPR